MCIIQVFVVPPSEMTFLPSKVEAVIGHTLHLPLQVSGYTISVDSPKAKAHLLPFSDCRKMKVSFSSSEISVFNISISPDLPSTGGACLMLNAVASKVGNTRVSLTYKHDDIQLEASITIATYPPLIPVNPEVIAVVTLGSSKNFIFEGGPSPWILDRSKYYDKRKVVYNVHVAMFIRGGGGVPGFSTQSSSSHPQHAILANSGLYHSLPNGISSPPGFLKKSMTLHRVDLLLIHWGRFASYSFWNAFTCCISEIWSLRMWLNAERHKLLDVVQPLPPSHPLTPLLQCSFNPKMHVHCNTYYAHLCTVRIRVLWLKLSVLWSRTYHYQSLQFLPRSKLM